MFGAFGCEVALVLFERGGTATQAGGIGMKFNRNFDVPAYAFASFALLGAVPAIAGSYTYTTLLPSGATGAIATSINDSDQVAGGAVLNGVDSGGYIWSAGTFTPVTIKKQSVSYLSAINDAGVATSKAYKGGTQYIFTYALGTGILQETLLPKKTNYIIGGIDGSGTVIATSNTSKRKKLIVDSATVSGTTLTAFAYPGAEGTAAKVISPGGVVAGNYYDTMGLVHSFIYQAGTYTTLSLPGVVAQSVAINFIHDDGTLGGAFFSVADGPVGFIMSGGTITTYNYPISGGGMSSTYIVGIDAAGDVAGDYQDASGNGHGFIYTGGTYYDIDAPGATNTAVVGINSLGSLVGNYRVGQGGPVQAFIAQCPAGQSPCTQ